MPISYHIRYLKCYRPTKAVLWKHHKLGLTLLPSFVISFLSPIWSVNSFSRLFDYLFAHQCQSSAVANVPSSSPGPRLCVWELPEAIQTANILHHTNMQSFTLHTKTFKLLLRKVTAEILWADSPCPVLGYALNEHNSIQSINTTSLQPSYIHYKYH